MGFDYQADKNTDKKLDPMYKSMLDFAKNMKHSVQSSDDAARFEGIARRIAQQAKEIYLENRKREAGLIR